MLIVWGSKGYQEILGQHGAVSTCSHCNNDVNMQVMEIGRKFTLFWIPLFKFGRKYYLMCPVCNYGHELTKEQKETLVG